MPKTDGLELCRRIRTARDRDYTYLILLTAKNRKGDIVEGMGAGADDFIAKPFDSAELEVRIRAGERVLGLEWSLNERNREIQEVNDLLKRWVQREYLLNQVSRAINESLELNDVLRAAVTQLQELSRASRAFAMLVSADGRSLRVANEHCQQGIEPIRARSFSLEQKGAGCANDALVIGDLNDEPASTPDVLVKMARRFAARSLLAAPIVHQGGWLGVVGLHQYHEPRSWEEDEVSLVKAIAQQMAVAISHAQLYEQLQEQAVRDGLTGLYNRRYFDQILPREIERARRFGHVLSLVMVDLDHLKRINDQLGHQAGDAAIREVGQVLATKPRRTDIAARYGGEEFAVILVETPLAGARAAAEAWRREIHQRLIAEGRQLSASIGLASYPQHATTAEELIKAADQALYRAKRDGRNRVCTVEDKE
jgi:diguanylate cyclase (GGDEF)-like protein